MSYTTNLGSNASKEELSDAINFLLANVGTNSLTSYVSVATIAITGIFIAKSAVVVPFGQTTSQAQLTVYGSDGTSNPTTPPTGTYKSCGGLGNGFGLWVRVR